MKNAILMIDFALQAQRRDGMSPDLAIRQAARLRLRAILMTNLAGLLGAVPLAIGFIYLYLERLRQYVLRDKSQGMDSGDKRLAAENTDATYVEKK